MFQPDCACRACLTHGCPGQSHDHAGGSDVIHAVDCEQRFANIVVQIVWRDSDRSFLTTNDLECNLAKHLGTETGIRRLQNGDVYILLPKMTYYLKTNAQHTYTLLGSICDRKTGT